MDAEATRAELKARYHVEGQGSTVGPRWGIWDGVKHFLRFRHIADEGDAVALCAQLNEYDKALTRPAEPDLRAVLEEARPYVEAYCQEHGETGTLLQSKLVALLARVDAALHASASQENG